MIDALPLLLSDEGYQISRSVRLRSSASAFFSRTPGSAGDRQKFTISFWFKRGLISTLDLFTGNNANGFLGGFRSDNTLYLYDAGAASGGMQIWSARVFRDPSAWYHLVIAVDTTQATDTNRFKVYINGVQENTATWNVGAGASRYPSLNANFDWNNTNSHEIGYAVNYGYFDGYLTEFNNVSGQQLDASSFGETNTTTGAWQPKKYAGTYGTNGFYLNFSDNSAATAAAIGKDYSGNGNNWTPNNISVTAGVTFDSMLDVPTQWADGGNGRGNYAVMNPLSGLGTISNANLRNVASGTDGYRTSTLAIPSSGKWYFEMSMGATVAAGCGITTRSFPTAVNQTESRIYYSDGNKYSNGSGSAYGATFTLNDIIGISYDADAGTLSFLKNNTSQGTAFSSLGSFEWFFYIQHSGVGTSDVTINFGQRPFAYTPPTGFRALNTLNLPTPTILKGNQYFNVITYTGTGSTRTQTGVGFQPDFTWVKRRDAAADHGLMDSVRGASQRLQSNLTAAEDAFGFTAFASDGFTFNGGIHNDSGWSFAAWNWKEGPTQGFDIVTYTGTGANRTVAHNLGVVPNFIIIKCRSNATNWFVGGSNIAAAGNGTWSSVMEGLNTTSAVNTGATAVFNSTAPTSSVFSLGTEPNANGSGRTFVAYLFSEVAGFSRFGSYTGNGSADGPFVFCGFRPRLVLYKRTDRAGDAWMLFDTARGTFNLNNAQLYPNQSTAEFNGSGIDILSNGFKLRDSDASHNGSGGTYIFMAFAENPFKNALAR